MESHYKKQCAEIRRQTDGLDISASVPMHNQFTFFSANMEHFLPLVPADRHERLFREALRYQRMGSLDLQYGVAGYLPDITGWDTRWAGGLRHRPAIVTCAHMGAHMLIGLLLAKARVPVALLVASHLVQPLHEIWRAGARADPALVLPHILDASSSTSMRQLIRYAQGGVSVLVYWDGEEHSGGLGNHGSRLSVPFLGQHILLHRGIAFIAHKTQTPIVPIASFRQQDGSVGIRVGEQIQPSTIHQNEFIPFAMQSVVSHFSPYILHFPSQWDKWAHVQRLVYPERFFIESGRVLSRDYGILHGDDSYFLFGRRDYRAMALSRDDLAGLGRRATKR